MALALELPTFATVLRRCRTQAGLTQEALAERAGLSRRGIQNLESGIRRPYRDTLQRLASALSLTAEQRGELELVGSPTPRHAAGSGRRGASGGALVSNLPAQLTPLIGRDRELGDVARLLASGRLVTLAGPPGIGKSRLAIEAAARAASGYRDGAHFVALASLRDPALVATSIAAALGVRAASGRPIQDALVETLRARQTLLVLDNFEHVLDAAPALGELLAACAHLSLLATSRAALQLYGERQFDVPPLALPEAGRAMGVDHLVGFGAVRLFAERASAIDPRFALTAANAGTVAEVCRRLDGLPLAIELAASRIRILAPEAILERLDHRFGVLSAEMRDAPARHRTMRGAIDWSYDLLAPEEQALLQQLSVFVGGWTLEALDAVCRVPGPRQTARRSRAGPRGPGLPEPPNGSASASKRRSLTPILEMLVVKSLVWKQPGDGEARFTMLESIREYAAERLEAGGGVATARRRHAEYYLAMAEAVDRLTCGPLDVPWLDRIERNLDNARAAFQFFVDHGDASEALRLGTALGKFWSTRGHLTEGRARLEAVLTLPGAQGATRERATALAFAATAADYQGDFLAERQYLEASLAIWRELDDRFRIADSLDRLGLCARNRGDYAEARTFLYESLAMHCEMGNQVEIGVVLDRIGHTALYLGDHDTAWSLLQQSLAIRRGMDDAWGAAYALHNLGLVARDRGEHEEARMLFDEALELQRGLDYRVGVVETTGSLGALALDVGDVAAARDWFTESLTLGRALGSLDSVALHVTGFAGIAFAEGCCEPCLRLAGAAAAWREEHRVPLHPTDFPKLDTWLARARDALGPGAAAAADAAGRAMTLDQAAAEALAGDGR